MAVVPEATTEFPTPADGNITSSGPPRPAVTACHLAKDWVKPAGVVVAVAVAWLIVIAILIAV
jgi:hypothetical protein